MNDSQHDAQPLVVFTVAEQQFALPLPAVERILRTVEVTPLPGAADGVLGVIDVQGQIVPVISLRTKFGYPQRPLDLDEHLILARTTRRSVALVVDSVSGVLECARQDMTSGEGILPGIEYEWVARSAEGMILVQNLDRLLSLEVESTLEAALPAPELIAAGRS